MNLHPFLFYPYQTFPRKHAKYVPISTFSSPPHRSPSCIHPPRDPGYRSPETESSRIALPANRPGPGRRGSRPPTISRSPRSSRAARCPRRPRAGHTAPCRAPRRIAAAPAIRRDREGTRSPRNEERPPCRGVLRARQTRPSGPPGQNPAPFGLPVRVGSTGARRNATRTHPSLRLFSIRPGHCETSARLNRDGFDIPFLPASEPSLLST